MTNVWLLGLVSMLTDVSTEMVYPLLPLYLMEVLGGSPTILGLIEGVAESLAGLLRVISGHMSDRLGRPRLLAIGGYSLSAIGKLLLLQAGTWGGIFAARTVDRFGKGVRTAPRDFLVAAGADRAARGRAFGLHRGLDTAGALLGGVVAYLLLRGGDTPYRAVFAWSVLPAVLGVLVLFRVREPVPCPRGPQSDRGRGSTPVAASPRAANPRKGLWAAWHSLDPQLRRLLLVVLLFSLGNSSNQFLLLRARAAGYSAAGVILLFLVYNLAYSLLSYPAGRLSDTWGRRAVLVGGYAVYGLVYLGFAVATGPGLWWAFIGYGCYSALTEGVEKALVADAAPRGQEATLLGLHAALVGLGLLPASLLAGCLWQWVGPSAPFWWGGASGLLAACALATAPGSVAPRRPARVGPAKR